MIKIERNQALMDGKVIASVGDRKWWGVRIYAEHAGKQKGLPGFLGGLGRRRDLGKYQTDAKYNGKTIGIFRNRSAAFKALIEWHLNEIAAAA